VAGSFEPPDINLQQASQTNFFYTQDAKRPSSNWALERLAETASQTTLICVSGGKYRP
jgi:hypothetical protein